MPIIFVVAILCVSKLFACSYRYILSCWVLLTPGKREAVESKKAMRHYNADNFYVGKNRPSRSTRWSRTAFETGYTLSIFLFFVAGAVWGRAGKQG